MRCAGVLAAVFSLPGEQGIGDFGEISYRFVDRIHKAGFKIWQVLPLNPVGYGNSPYQPYSSYAGDPIYINLDNLYEEGLLPEKPEVFQKDSNRVDYAAVREWKEKYFRLAFEGFTPDAEYEEFIRQEWVYLYGVFYTFKMENHQAPWVEWAPEMKNWILDRKMDLSPFEKEIRFHMFLQYEFHKQWMKLKKYANKQQIKIMGDIPFYVGQDSLDVWSNQKEFLLDKDGHPIFIAGVPPDYFSETGQRWGNPIYDWDRMEKNDFSFWRARLKGYAGLYDYIRIDHFRAFDTYWKIPSTCETAIEGEWIEAPGYALFDRVLPELKGTKIVAEDLGELRKEVLILRDHYRFPGMDVRQFTILDPKAKFKKNMIAYTGTHDNDTTKHWFASLKKKEKKAVREVLKQADIKNRNIARAMVRLTLKSVGKYAILPIQDIMSLGEEGRMNTPGTIGNENWTWKMNQTSFSELEKELKGYKKLLKEYGRS